MTSGSSSSPSATSALVPQRAITTWEDWRAFVARPSVQRPIMPSTPEYEQMDPVMRKRFNQIRNQYHDTFGPIEVPAMSDVHDAALRLARQNLRASPGARPGIILDGLGTVGKSTIVMQLGRRYERMLTQNHTVMTTPSGHVYLPVAYVNLPGAVSILNFNWLLAQFYNIPVSRSVKDSFLTAKIKEYAANCGTSMVILDDIHFLQMKNRSHSVVNNHIKHLANSISATFVYAGINCEGTGLLAEGHSPERAAFSQTGHRFKKFEITPFSLSSDISCQQYKNVIDFFEANLLLLRQPAKSLYNDLGRYIFERTGGYMGAIATLLRECASLAIETKGERISRELLSKITLDDYAEKEYAVIEKRRRAEAR